jgi:hypothetical protein
MIMANREFAIARAFDHKAFGRIGLVNMTASVGKVMIGDKELPASSVEYLLTFALQNLQDAYAGADSAEDATARFDKKLARLVDGTIGVREAGSGVSAEIKVRRTVMGELLRKSDAGKAALKAREDDRDVFLDEVFAKQAEAAQAAIMATVAERIAEAQAKAKQAAKLADSITL